MKTILRTIAILTVAAVFGCAAYFAIQTLIPPPDAISSAAPAEMEVRSLPILLKKAAQFPRRCRIWWSSLASSSQPSRCRSSQVSDRHD
jgi:hypothetical protein